MDVIYFCVAHFKMAIDKLHVCPTIDLFASRYNHQVLVFVSWRPEPESFAVDAFTLNWHELQFSCFPPFSVMAAVSQKIVLKKATGIVVMPNWPTQPFYATSMKLLIDYPKFMRKSKREVPRGVQNSKVRRQDKPRRDRSRH